MYCGVNKSGKGWEFLGRRFENYLLTISWPEEGSLEKMVLGQRAHGVKGSGRREERAVCTGGMEVRKGSGPGFRNRGCQGPGGDGSFTLS